MKKLNGESRRGNWQIGLEEHLFLLFGHSITDDTSLVSFFWVYVRVKLHDLSDEVLSTFAYEVTAALI